MVGDRLGVAGLGVAHALGEPPPTGRILLGRQLRRHEHPRPKGAHDVREPARVGNLGRELVLGPDEQVVGVTFVDPVDVQIALDIGAGQPELARGRHQIAQAALGLQLQDDVGVRVAAARAVIGRERERRLVPEDLVGEFTDGQGHRRPTTFA